MAPADVEARPEPPLADLAAERRRLWGLAYRLTGSAADADDVVQETLARWYEQSPTRELTRGWLVRVATNLGLDVLRARRRRGYPGVWLPAPVPCDDAADDRPSDAPSPEARYGRAESATAAFLIALEALTPRQRAVLILRDVAGYSPAETAAALATSEGNVRVVHTRARRALAAYDRARCIPTAALRVRHRAALEAFLRALQTHDAAALEAMLAEAVRTVTDAGGEYTALATPLVGRARVARFYLRAALNRVAAGPTVAVRSLNGLPGAVITLARPVRRQAPCTVMAIDLDADGRIATVRTIMAARKLGALGRGSDRLV